MNALVSDVLFDEILYAKRHLVIIDSCDGPILQILQIGKQAWSNLKKSDKFTANVSPDFENFLGLKVMVDPLIDQDSWKVYQFTPMEARRFWRTSITKARMEYELKFGKDPKDLYVTKPVLEAILELFGLSTRFLYEVCGKLDFCGMKVWLVESEIPIRVN